MILVRIMPTEHYGQERMEAAVVKAGRLRAETMVTVKWIGERLAMGTTGYVNNRLYRWRKGMLK